MRRQQDFEDNLRQAFDSTFDKQREQWVDEEVSSWQTRDIQRATSVAALHSKWDNLSASFAFDRSLTITNKCSSSQSAPGQLSTSLNRVIMVQVVNAAQTYVIKAEVAGNRGATMAPRSIEAIFIWPRSSGGQVIIVQEEGFISLYSFSEPKSGRSAIQQRQQQAIAQPQLTLQPDKAASKRSLYSSNLMLATSPSSPTLCLAAFPSIPISFLPVNERCLVLIHG